MRPVDRPAPGQGPCRECGGEKKIAWLDGIDVKERPCPHCHGTGEEPGKAPHGGGEGYWTK